MDPAPGVPPEGPFGGILADQMGLGKTVEIPGRAWVTGPRPRTSPPGATDAHRGPRARRRAVEARDREALPQVVYPDRPSLQDERRRRTRGVAGGRYPVSCIRVSGAMLGEERVCLIYALGSLTERPAVLPATTKSPTRSLQEGTQNPGRQKASEGGLGCQYRDKFGDLMRHQFFRVVLDEGHDPEQVNQEYDVLLVPFPLLTANAVPQRPRRAST